MSLRGVYARLTILAAVMGPFATPNVVAQEKSGAAVTSAVTTPAWDVISIKPNKSDDGRTRIMMTPDGFHADNVSVRMLAANAYGVKPDLITGGPSWLDSARFDINAKVSGEDVAVMDKLSREERRTMLQALLVERFGWKGHTEVKELPIYELMVAKGGIKLKEATPGDTYENGIKGPDGKGAAGMVMMRPGQLNAQGATLGSVVGSLSSEVQRTVVDKTGLTGKYDITLKWAPESSLGRGGDNGHHEDGSSDSEASIFTALQEQLGLRLQSSKGPVDTYVVDHVEQPAEN